MFRGTSRVCEACGASFVLEEPRALAEARQARVEAARRAETARLKGLGPDGQPRELLALGCEACGLIFRLRVVGTPETVACAWCGARQALSRARALQGPLEAAEEAMWRALLAGQGFLQAMKAMEAAGLPQAAARRVLEARAARLPMVRLNALQRQRSQGLEVRLERAAGCDTCGRPLAGAVALHAIAWARTTQGELSLSPRSALTVFAGALVFSRDAGTDELQGAYYLCDDCRKGFSAWFGSRYAGFPVTEGYALRRLWALG